MQLAKIPIEFPRLENECNLQHYQLTFRVKRESSTKIDPTALVIRLAQSTTGMQKAIRFQKALPFNHVSFSCYTEIRELVKL